MKAVLIVGTSCVALGGACAPAFAEQSPASSPATASLFEVIVTASKREESLQEVPIAVTALSGNALEERNVVNPRELVYLVPSLQMTTGNVNMAEGYQVRGVGTSSFSSSLQQSVSTVLDGVPLALPAMGRMSFADIERVEVLRGPQGMLFGRNASAGLVNIVTKLPQLDAFAAEAHASYGVSDEFDEIEARGTINLPLGDTTAMRVNTYYTDREGYIENAYTGAKLNGYDDRGVKTKFLWKPSDDFQLLVIGDYSTQTDPFRITPISAVTPGSVLANLYAQYGIVARPGNNRVTLDGPVFGNSDNAGGVIRAEWAVGDHTLTSTSAYRYFFVDGNQDLDQIPTDFLNTAETLGSTTRQYSQELTLTSPAGRRFEYVAGLFYDRYTQKLDNLFAGPLGSPALLAARVHTDTEMNSIAAYGQSTIHLTDTTRAVIGARVTHDFNELGYFAYTPAGAVVFPTFPPVPEFRQEDENTNFSWRVGLQHDLNDDLMGYATVARGYKGPGFDSTSIAPGSDQRVAPEIPTSYELGLKSTLLDARVVLNIAAFYTEFKDFQAQTATQVGVVNIFRVQNAGELETKGVEIDFSARPFESFFLTGGVAYTEAIFADFTRAACYSGQTIAQGCDVIPGTTTRVTDASGNALPNSPRWVFTLSGTYEAMITSRLRMFINGNYYYRDDVSLNAAGDPVQALPSRGLFGASIGIGADDDRWRLSVTGKNLADHRFFGSVARGGTAGAFGATRSANLSPESYRTIYVNFDWNF